MLLSKDAIAEVTELIGPEDFYRGAHRTLFEGAQALYDRGEPVDAVLLADEMERQGTLEDVGGALAITDLVGQVPTAANALYYARIVADNALRRRLIDAGTGITKLGYDPAGGVDEAVDAAESLVFKVAQDRRKVSQFKPLKDLIREGIDILERLQENNSSITGLETGFVDFDELTAGLQPGNLVILAARPSMGKSTLATNIAAHVAGSLRRSVLMFSLEMSTAELVQRLLASEGRVDLKRLRTGRLEDSDWPKLSQAMGRLGESKLFLDDNSAITLMEIRSKCRRLKQHYGLDLVVIDYLQLMQSHRRIENRVQEVSEISRGLKVLAKELNVPVIALSQLNRKPEERPDKRPQLSDLRESGAVEQDADIVAFLYRDEVYNEDTAAKGEAELIVSKHRNGPLKTIPLSFIGHHSRFANMARGMPPI
jgi:replicative DNA helicase